MLQSRLPEIAHRVGASVDAALVEGAQLIRQSAEIRVPVDTGRLRHAIHVEIEPEGIYIVAGNEKVFYGHIVEHGGVNEPAHPFLVPALEEQRGPIEYLVAEAVRKAAAA